MDNITKIINCSKMVMTAPVKDMIVLIHNPTPSDLENAYLKDPDKIIVSYSTRTVQEELNDPNQSFVEVTTKYPIPWPIFLGPQDKPQEVVHQLVFDAVVGLFERTYSGDGILVFNPEWSEG